MDRLSLGFAAFLCFPAWGHIHSLQPAETTAGAAGFTLRVLGAEFEFNEFLKWNGTPLSTTYIGPEELRAFVPASLLTTPGPVTVSLSSGGTPSGYGYEYNTPSGNTARFTIHPPPVITTVSPLPPGSTSAAYSRTLAAAGGTTPFRWSIAAGALPGGVGLDAATGVLAGTPRAEGSFRFTVRLTDRASVEASKEFLLVIGQGPVQGSEPSCAVTPQNLLLSMHHPSAHVAGGIFPLAPDHIVRVAVTSANGSMAAGVSVQMSATRGVFANGSSSATSVTGTDGIAKFVVNPPAPQGFDRADLTATFVVQGKPYPCAGSVLTGVGLLSAMRERLSGTVQTALSRLRRQYDVDYRRFGDEARAMLERDHDLAAEALLAVERYEPKLQRVLAGEEVRLRAGELEKLEKVLDRMKQRATPEFRAAMTEWMQELYRAQPKVRYDAASPAVWKAPPFTVGRPPASGADGRNVRLNFEANVGQAGSGRREVRYLARGAVHQAMFTEEGTVILRTPMTDPVRVRFGKGKPELVELTGSMTHYLAGNDPRAWRTGIPHHARLRYRDVFPGADLVFYGDEGQLRYDFVLRPNANPNKIAVTFEGIRGVEPLSNGELILHTDGGVLRLGVPYVYQLDDNGRPQAIAARYRSRGSGNRIGFELAKYNAAKPLVIDPVIQYASFAGGMGEDAGLAVKADAQGSAYVAGFSGTTDIQAFVTKFSADGSRILYTTYFGGSGVDIATGLALDAQGNVYVCGSTSSADFPVANGFRMTYAGGPGALMADGFVVKIDASGSRIVHGSFIGGSGADAATGIAADAAGNAYVTGYTGSLDFPVRNGVQAANRGGTYMKSDGFVLKVNAAGNALEYSTYLGGSGDDTGLAIALDAAGHAYVAGTTHSEDFPVTAALQASRRSETDGFVTKLSPAGNALVYSTYLGGSSDDSVAAIAVDATGAAYVAGVTGSSNFPVIPASNAAQVKPGSTDGLGFDAFAAKLTPAGNALVYATFLGGSGTEMAHGIAVDASGAAYVVGETGSADYPVTNPLRLAGSGTDSFVTKLNPSGTAMEYSSYLGGQSLDSAAAVALDAVGNVYVAGSTASPDHAVTAGAAGARLAGRSDAFAIKITPEGTTPPLAEARSAASLARGMAVAADSVVSILGSGFVNGEEYAEYPREEIRGLRVEITDGQGATRNAPLYLASASRIDVVVPADVAPGSVAALRVIQGSSLVAAGSMLVQNVAPGIFTENGRGSGPPRGWAVRVEGGDGGETVLPLGQCGSNSECEPLELDLGSAGARVTLTLLATGARKGTSVEMMAGGDVVIPVLGTAAHADFPGYDQIVVGPLPEALRGRGVVELVLTVDGERANPVRIRVK